MRRALSTALLAASKPFVEPVVATRTCILNQSTQRMANAGLASAATEMPPLAELCDEHLPDPVDVTTTRKVQIVDPIFRDYGGRLKFHGQVTTVKCFENNPLVRETLCEEQGNGRVLVVDGGASMRCALMGDFIAGTAVKNGWSGVIINGCLRDSEEIAQMPLGVKALNTHPLKSAKRDKGLRDVPLTFGGVNIKPNDWVYVDRDGILVSPEKLV